ncbi:C4-dicarboxylate ABC transporter permease [Roseobacter sp. HKCCD9010]|uniref:tripartite tricarboxylate transporter permease n=1 Tax=unclassified Roseobacter TaxID=196798 RepID=UPI00149258F3|nr:MULTISPECIES: tripartite tricarboxylate transporter permease [unclassified Roseobacter]MBF9051622.1 C4-dicarboxylate ABC transporter permease [Rhodobacterales bacterium HKCCD4356]NNV13146.1 C4-dicarboxylate ABC transporter permease [Roseobacter sp. HKCCD7357]NNV17397.1 C4-dicarboxylate ABC transporter permease [Roseobacter sp. HKCCD8768]NNV27003.1 C4-dicarboxylate ABC transporter permease [Roseobacter sp. HKCCD8192]NNV31123.1 C4-dicarboxylate ABC transporter permease [Roseobacter sp. HKCCD9
MLEAYGSALAYLFGNPSSFLLIIFSVIWGIAFGSVPGLTGIVGVALLIPFTFVFDPTAGLLLLSGVYVGSTFGGSISAILFNTPGSPEAACTALDGYPMAKKGQAGKALGIALASSAIGGIFGTIVLMLLAPPMAQFALNFGPPEYFALAVLGITAISAIGGGSVLKGLVAGLLGLGIATVGLDPITGTERYTFGNLSLLTGISFVPAIIGTFALAEVLQRAGERTSTADVITDVSTKLPSMKEFLATRFTLLRSSSIGAFIGALPGVGATTAAFISYSEAVRWSKRPQDFGTGVAEGIAAPESANNSAVGGSMIPLLALGIPGSATTAVMLGGLTIHGIIPGPLLMETNTQLVYTVFIGMFVANILMLIFGIRAARYFALVLKAPYALVGPAIVVLCMTGVYALNSNIVDVGVMLAMGAFGFLLRKLKYPIASFVIGLVLGPIAERSLRQGLVISDYDYWDFASRPITAVLLIGSLASLIYGFYGQWKRHQIAQAAKLSRGQSA